MNIKNTIFNTTKNVVGKSVIEPIGELVNENLSDITTTIGSFIIRKIRGSFQRSITFSVGNSYADDWMEQALYGILYKYNDIKKSSALAIKNAKGYTNGAGMYYNLDDGAHNLKYRKFDILLIIQSISSATPGGRSTQRRDYTIITYDLSPDFVTLFEKDMIAHRNSLLKIKSDSSTFTLWRDGHEGDGTTYWIRQGENPKRRLNTIYLPLEQKKLLVNTVNQFMMSKKYYQDHGIAHNLKILLHGLPGCGKDSIAKMIASEWNRNLCYTTGGKDGRFIPNAITDDLDELLDPLFLISDIDKYPFLINESDYDMNDDKAKDENMKYKQCFGNMINALDGVLSGEDKIIIMTTNHIEKFSDVFLRPGRIDLIMELKPVIPDVFRKFTYDFYGNVLPKDIKLRRDDIRVAELQFDAVIVKLTYDEFVAKYTK